MLRDMNYNFNSTAQHSTAQHSTAQHSTAQHSTAQINHRFITGELCNFGGVRYLFKQTVISE